ncbi:MAG: molybdopterin-dependent oxidoreductase [Desulfovibrio sp.]|nr:molybdopterin-dependent oxidoreductase [Desulfovibrio sp.]
MPETVRSVCPHDCPDCCSLLVEREAGRILRVAGDPGHPFTRGFLCTKARHYEDTVHSPLRLAAPLRRTGPKGSGRFAPVSWEEALAETAERLQACASGYGPESILPYAYAGTMGYLNKHAYTPLFRLLGASELGRTICTPAKAMGWQAVMGATPATPPAEAAGSDFLVLWGLSVLATGVHFIREIKEAKRRGAMVVLIDVYETPTARLADVFIRVKPGSDGALALGVLHEMAGRGLLARSFIDAHVHGFAEFERTVLPRWTLAEASRASGVPEALIQWLALAYASAKAPFIRLGGGLSRYANGAMNVRLVTLLPAAAGAWGRPGAGMLSSCHSSSAYDLSLVQRPDFRKPGARQINMCLLGKALETPSRLAGPPVKALFVWSANPAASAPDQNAVLRGLAREDLFCCVHERFLTDTARYADIVLPATTALEHDDVYASYGSYCLQRGRPAIPPQGQAKSNWDACRLLAKALGRTEAIFEQSAEAMVDRLVESTAHSSWQLAPEEVERLREGLPVPLRLPEGYATDFKTPTGKIQAVNEAEPQALPDWFPAETGEGAFAFVSAPSPRTLSSSFCEQDRLAARDVMVLLMHPDDARALGLEDGGRALCSNRQGEAEFTVKTTARVPQGLVASEGVWWSSRLGGKPGVNALTSQRLTDRGEGSTFSGVRVDIRRAD